MAILFVQFDIITVDSYGFRYHHDRLQEFSHAYRISKKNYKTKLEIIIDFWAHINIK